MVMVSGGWLKTSELAPFCGWIQARAACVSCLAPLSFFARAVFCAADQRRDEDLRACRARDIRLHAELVTFRAHGKQRPHGQGTHCPIMGEVPSRASAVRNPLFRKCVSCTLINGTHSKRSTQLSASPAVLVDVVHLVGDQTALKATTVVSCARIACFRCSQRDCQLCFSLIVEPKRWCLLA